MIIFIPRNNKAKFSNKVDSVPGSWDNKTGFSRKAGRYLFAFGGGDNKIHSIIFLEMPEDSKNLKNIFSNGLQRKDGHTLESNYRNSTR